MSYNIDALPENGNIEVSGSPLSPFMRMEGAERHGEVVILPFTQETATTLRKFLRGEPVTMSLQTKTYLKLLADKGEQELKSWTWSLNLHDLRGKEFQVGVKKKAKNLETLWDLIHYIPIRYIDKSNPQKVAELTLNTWSVVVGTIQSITYKSFIDATEVVVEDVDRSVVSAMFFRQHWLSKQFRAGEEVILYGNYSEYVNKGSGVITPQITNAKLEKVGNTYENGHAIAPVYSEKAGLKKIVVAKEVEKLLEKVAWIEDPVPDVILEKYKLMTRNEAYRKLHFPDTLEEAKEARRRIAFDDFVRLQVFLLNSKNAQTEERKGKQQDKHSWSDRFITSLPFEFTGAQKRVTQEISEDMAGDKPMLRLLHGEVGSGKSEVSFVTILNAIESGSQVAFLVPTTILAEQLFERFNRDMTRAGFTDKEIMPALFHTGVKMSERKKIIQRLADKEVNVLIGTHSILSQSVEFPDLGLVVIDEQHKFGTKHRSALQQNYTLASEVTPDVLMMSATPIPRSMAQTIYGDMSLSVIDELPAERKQVYTYWEEDEAEVWESTREQVNLGHQAYVIAALVEESESEKLENVENATATQAFLQASIFPEFKVGLVHGKMKSAEKSAVLEAFYKNEINILVSTSVIEVGVNVPNATVMTILNANRFGIASLHQIRGRVGRGEHQSYCYLIGEATNPDAEERLNAMVVSNDGFWLAEKDLEIRGEGSLFKDAQHGDNEMIVGNLREHRKLLTVARRVAASAAHSPRLQAEVKAIFGDSVISS